MAVGRCSWLTAELREVQFRGFFCRLDRSAGTQRIAIKPFYARRSRTLPLPRTGRAALRSPCDAGRILLPPSAGFTYRLNPLFYAEEACRIFNRARDAMAGVDEVSKCACPSTA